MFAEYIDVSLANLHRKQLVAHESTTKIFGDRKKNATKIFQALATDYLHWSSDAHDSFVNSQFDLNVHPKI